MCHYLQIKGDSVWTSTFLAASQYDLERDSSVIQVQQYTNNSVTFTVTNSLRPDRFFHPLTVLYPVSGAITRAWAVRQGGSPVEVNIKGQKIMVSLVPGSAPVRVAWE